MADLRVEVQKQILSVLAAGTYYPVSYVPTTVGGIVVSIPTVGDTAVKPASLQCNEMTSGLAESAKFNPREKGFVFRNWRFTAFVEFATEVSFAFFFTEEAKNLTFEVDGYFVSVTMADFTVEHPAQQGSANGTKATVGFTVNTRR